MKPSLGSWVWAALIVTAGVMMLEQFDPRLAMIFAILILLAAFLRYPAALSEIQRMVRMRSPLPPGEVT